MHRAANLPRLFYPPKSLGDNYIKNPGTMTYIPVASNSNQSVWNPPLLESCALSTLRGSRQSVTLDKKKDDTLLLL